ncbi:hypothetical protein OPV22_014766 [Ensete ventricosum]|uniref:DUF4408 domain-containing protein n=1 Tax=Ensete ventricosum TaxID=4639 RepID=A0A426X055_ENSVE|nr:hypothetical protein OPV22_014766 [Ensete ventricosum]RRT32855.1 hypothetical protein B296_00057333 [Ensete ventricosum]RWV97387.1 hypothetical protein GW17_00039823 [Ensete ventricosum]RWW37250.1 hypothetical protein BHE74_00057667 [Ensete ventricosum]RZS09579.1 hypothetical protein BHM03_00040669 [Ensete ventricosum]
MDEAKQPRRGAAVDHVIIRFLLPVSVLFLGLSYCHSCYVRLLSVEFTASVLNDLDHFISRKAMLLFCNALLLFVTRDSGLLGFFAPTTNSSDEESDHKQLRRDHGDPKTESATTKPRPVKENAAVTSGGETKACEVEEKAEAGGDASLELVAVEGTDMERVDEDGTEDEDIEELNRKIEEFIERVKSERRMEARQLVVV